MAYYYLFHCPAVIRALRHSDGWHKHRPHRLYKVEFRVISGADALHLTETQRKVAEHVAKGLTNKQITGQLQVSENTVVTHVRRILRANDLTSRGRTSSAIAADYAKLQRSSLTFEAICRLATYM